MLYAQGHASDSNHVECDDTLTSLHLYTRTIRSPNSDPLTTKRGLSIVGRYAFPSDDHVPLATSRIAARCLNNIIVLAEPMRQVFVDEQYPQKVIDRLKVPRPSAPIHPPTTREPHANRIANRKATLRTNSHAPTYFYSPRPRPHLISGHRSRPVALQSLSMM